MNSLHSRWHSRSLGISIGLVLMVGILTTSTAWAQSALPAPGVQIGPLPDEPQTLPNPLLQLEGMLASVDELIADVTHMAKTYLEAVHVAPTVDERARYETLYTQTSASLAELLEKRSRIAQLVVQIREKLGVESLAK